MNHVYRVVYNSHTNTYQAVPEISSGHHQTQSTTSETSKLFLEKMPFSKKTISLIIAAFSPMAVYAAPEGGEVVRGAATISQQGKLTDIHQTTPKAAINWQKFGIKADEAVRFRQPDAQSVTLNRVVGNERSLIDGSLTANGKVFIQNPNGMLIGNGAKINVGGLVATTANISDHDFMNGFHRFQGGKGEISHSGSITVPVGGTVALIAPIVKNQGRITAPQGNALLASAEAFTLKFDGDDFSYKLDKGTLQGLVDNGGAVIADGGRIVLTAQGTDAVKQSLIKHSGIAQAHTVQNKNGVIELLGDLNNTRLEVSGSLKAEAKQSGDGGFIETSAAKVNIADNAKISTRAEQGKTGTWLIDPNDYVVASTGGDITGQQVSDYLKDNNLVLKSINGQSDGNGDVIINDSISWDKNTLTLNAQNNIYINKDLNGTGNASLALLYGQATENGVQADGSESDYFLYKNVTGQAQITLPEGRNLTTQRGNSANNIKTFQVIHSLTPETPLYENVAIGRNIDLANNNSNFSGYKVSLLHGLGNRVSNLHIDHTQNVESNTTPKPVGFISELSGGVRDLTLNNVKITSRNLDACGGACSEKVGVGGLIGRAKNATVKNVEVFGEIEDLSNYPHVQAGGLIGIAADNVRVLNSYVDVNIKKQESTVADPLVRVNTDTVWIDDKSQGVGMISAAESVQPPQPPVNPKPPVTPQPPVNPKPPVTPQPPVNPKPPVTPQPFLIQPIIPNSVLTPLLNPFFINKFSGEQCIPLSNKQCIQETAKYLEENSKNLMCGPTPEAMEGCGFFVLKNNPDAEPRPRLAMGVFSTHEANKKNIEYASEKYGVNKDLVSSIMYLEESQGFYDYVYEPSKIFRNLIPVNVPDVIDHVARTPMKLFDFSINFGMERAGVPQKTFRPMNIYPEYWEGAFGDKEKLKDDAKYNIDNGTKMIAAIDFQVDRGQQALENGRIANPEEYSRNTDETVGTLYNNINSNKVTDYGARVGDIKKRRLYNDPLGVEGRMVDKAMKDARELGNRVRENVNDFLKNVIIKLPWN